MLGEKSVKIKFELDSVIYEKELNITDYSYEKDNIIKYNTSLVEQSSIETILPTDTTIFFEIWTLS